MDDTTLKTRDVRRRFDLAARDFDSADFVYALTRDGLLSRLEPLIVAAEAMLDLGCATGSAGASLRKRFGRGHIVSVDLSREMLRQAKDKRRWFTRRSQVQADAGQLPFIEQCFDVVFSNLLLPWINNPERVFAEVGRVLKPGGVFAFATLGPDSLLTLARAWSEVDSAAHVRRFADMHDVGDALVRAGLSDPVLDVDRLTIQYESARRLFDDLTRTGARNTLSGRSSTMLGKQRFARFKEALQVQAGAGGIGIELELVYGHAWGSGARGNSGEFAVDASRIPRRTR